jgi:DNA end-binding protein Ku
MARAMWSGAISFGLVTIPVKLFSATSSHNVEFNQFEKGTGERIRYKRVAEKSEREVEYRDIVKGHEVDDGKYVIVTPEELAAVEPTKSRTIDIEDFVDLDDIDPIYWNNTYYLAPAEDVGAEKPYALLLKAMNQSGKVAIARFVMRDKQYLATIRPIGKMLGLSTMYFADEVRGEDAVANAPVKVNVTEKELAMAEQLIDSLAGEWQPEKYEDTYQERVLDLIKRKAKGEDIVIEEREETPEVVDLMEALRASVEASKGGKKPPSSAKRAPSLHDLSKDELYERAGEVDIPGRSKMSKDELISALEEAVEEAS